MSDSLVTSDETPNSTSRPDLYGNKRAQIARTAEVTEMAARVLTMRLARPARRGEGLRVRGTWSFPCVSSEAFVAHAVQLWHLIASFVQISLSSNIE